MQRKILILGGTNYFGKHLVQLLLNNGDDITIVTRGNNPILKNCHAIIFDRNNPNEKLVSRHYWDVVYDQSCYASYSLKSLESVIKNCGCYILTSSQAVYSSGLKIKEDSIDYNDFNIASYENVIGDYGLEKIKSEYFIYQSDCHYIFPRLPTVIGVNDPKQRMQQFIKKLTANPIELPASNPSFNILDEYDAAKALYDLSFLAFKGAVNLASEETLSPRQLVSYFEPLLSRKPVISWVDNYPFIFSDMIKNDSKTLCLTQQQALQIKLSATNDVLNHFTPFAIAQVAS